MATATLASKLQVLPPAEPRRELNFDLHTGIRPKFPVSAQLKADGEIESTGLSFGDYSRMQTQEHKLAPHRRAETPEWAVNQTLMAKVVTRYMEVRAGFRKPQPGTLLARIHQAEKAIHEQRPELERRLTTLCQRFVAAKNAGADPSQVKTLQIEIQNLDSTLMSTEKGFAQKVVGAIFYYYRCGCDSVETAQRIGMLPPAVRQLLWRLARVFDRMLTEEPPTIEPPKRVIDVAVARAEGKRFHQIAVEFGICVATAFNYVKRARLAGIWIEDYASYVRYARQVGVEPLPYARWRILEPQFKPKGLRRHQAAFKPEHFGCSS